MSLSLIHISAGRDRKLVGADLIVQLVRIDTGGVDDTCLLYTSRCVKRQGLSGISSDFRDLVEAAAAGNDHAQTTLEAYAYRVGKYIGAYAAAMNGVDAIVFTAGIGEKMCIRDRITIPRISHRLLMKIPCTASRH